MQETEIQVLVLSELSVVFMELTIFNSHHNCEALGNFLSHF